ncbi:MAG: hypothetical protein RL015_2812 [Verrucomicrobiota bacterium]|jgi:hypothetical protein
MILCLESSLLGGYLSNEVPGLVTGVLHLAGIQQPMRVELVGNFMRDIAGCRVDFHNPLPNADLDDVAWLAQTQTGFTGVMTASNRVAKLPRRRRESDQMMPMPHGLKNLLFFEWFNQQAQRVLIQSWHLQLRVSAPAWQLPVEEESVQLRQARARRKHFLLTERNPDSDGARALHAPGMADPFEPQEIIGNPFTHLDEPKKRRSADNSFKDPAPDPLKRSIALAQELRRFERLLTFTNEVRNRPAVIRLLSTVVDLTAHLISALRQFSQENKTGWQYLVVDLEQSLPLFSAALNATDKLMQHSIPGTDQQWLANVQTSLLNIELRMRELLTQLR